MGGDPCQQTATVGVSARGPPGWVPVGGGVVHVGPNEGVAVEGDKVGDDVGSREGVSVVPVGLAVGAMEGLGDGASVGELTGDTDGADVQAQSKPSYGQPAGQVLTVVFFLVSQSSLLAVLTMEEEDSSMIFTRPVTRAIL